MTTTDCSKQSLIVNHIPESLRDILSSLAGLLTHNLFQVEIDRRLGALFRVTGIEMQIVPVEVDAEGDRQTEESRIDLPLTFKDGAHVLSLRFSISDLSQNSRQSIFDTTAVVLSDYLETLTSSSPQATTAVTNRLDNRHGTIQSDRVSEPVSGNCDPAYNAPKFAHRLRNSLAAIMSASNQLATTELSSLHPDDYTLAKIIETAAITQEELLKRYLMAFEPLRITLRELGLGAAVQSLVHQHDCENSCHTVYVPEIDEQRITADLKLLNRSVFEVLRNAHEASGNGQVSLRWCVADSRATILIKNTGEIAENDFDSTFVQPFQTTKSGHAGLGLTIARRYVGYLGGTMRAVSSHGHTIVTISLPLIRDEQKNQNIERESQCPPF